MTRLEVIVPKSDTSRVLRLMARKLNEIGVLLVPYRRGSIDSANNQESLVYCEVPSDFAGTQDVTNALYTDYAISTDNSVRKKHHK